MALAPLEQPPSLMAPGTFFSGHLILRGPVRIDGSVEGAITASGLLWIGEQARVRARVLADEVVIAGVIEGDVRGSVRIELRSSARVTGELRTPRFIAAEGSFLEGDCRAGPADAAAPAARATQDRAAP